ncbi:helix-turn-helix domain-containing protein [Devosia sp. A449]
MLRVWDTSLSMSQRADYPTIFKERLKALREAKLGLTQSGLGAAAGLSPVTISKFEQGVNLPTFGALMALCEALDVSPSDLVGWPSDGAGQQAIDTRLYKLQKALLKLKPGQASAILEMVEKLSRD